VLHCTGNDDEQLPLSSLSTPTECHTRYAAKRGVGWWQGRPFRQGRRLIKSHIKINQLYLKDYLIYTKNFTTAHFKNAALKIRLFPEFIIYK